jgi:hypothetical protein
MLFNAAGERILGRFMGTAASMFRNTIWFRVMLKWLNWEGGISPQYSDFGESFIHRGLLKGVEDLGFRRAKIFPTPSHKAHDPPTDILSKFLNHTQP